MSVTDKYEAIIGLEVHAQLSTNSKAYSSDSAEFGAGANVNISPISLGHPGTLPRVNKEVIKYAVKAGYALNCEINKYNAYARKNYFYADLPKGYQVTQDTTPICTNGHVTINSEGQEKKIGIIRIHMEEDSGKSMHDQDPYYSLIDLNRAGVPLIEIVSEPDLRSGEDAYQYLTEIRKLVRYLDICDGNMEEGSLRCDANISIRLKGSDKFGTRVEVKNMNSMRNVKRAIDYEVSRQAKLVEEGGAVKQQTMGFDPLSGKTFVMRSKEMAHDYRYFPEPDLPPVNLSEEYLKSIKEDMPELPNELKSKFQGEYGLSDYDASVLTSEKDLALYYNDLIGLLPNDKKAYKVAANWLIGPIKSYLNENAIEINDFPVSIHTIAGIIALVFENKISNSIAIQQLFPKVISSEKETNVELLAESLGLLHQTGNDDELKELINAALDRFPDKVEAYKAGNKNLLGLFMGEIMKASRGKFDPKQVSQNLSQMLDN